jgi:TP901 family phage tail tape measure protein
MIGMNSGQAMVSVGVAMILQDQFTNQANNIGKAYRDMMEEIYQSSGASRGLTEMVWSRGATAGALTVMGGLIDSYTYFADVQNDLFWATKMTNGGLEEQQALMERVREVNLVTPLTNKDLSSAARFMAMAGNTNEAIQHMLEPVAELSGVFGMQAGGKGGVADLFTNISMMFGRNLEDQQEAYNVANELYAVTTSSNTNLQDLAQAITYSGSEMRRAGYGLRETAASIGAMGNYGIQGSAAGTALANMMRYIQLSASGQKKKGSDMLAAVGIDAKSLMDSEGHLISLNEIYHKMYEVTKDLDTFSKNQFFYNVFGVRGTREIAAMVQMIEDAAGGASKYEEIMQRMQDATSTNELGKAYGEWTEGPAGQLAMFKAELDNLRTTVGEQIAPLFTPILHHLNSIMSMVGWLGKTGLGGAAIRAVAVGTAFQLTLRVLTAIRGIIRVATVGITQMSSAGGMMSAGPAAANTQFTLMEAHLRTLIILMGEYLAMNNMIPRGGIATPYGTVFAQGGRARITNPAAGVRGMGLNKGMNVMTGAAVGAAAAKSAGAAGGAAVARGLGSRIIGFLGGPWGIGLSIGIPLLIDLLTSNNDENRKQTELLEESLSASEMKSLEDEALINALRAACKDGIIDGVGSAKPVPVEVTIEGGGNYTNLNMGGNDFNIFE